MKKMIPALVAIVLIFVIVGATLGVKLAEKYSYSKERANMEEYFHIESENEAALIFQDELREEKAILMDGIYYLPFSFVKENLNDNFYLDEESDMIIYTDAYGIQTTKIGGTAVSDYDSDFEEVSKDQGWKAARYEGETVYLAMDFVMPRTNVSCELFDSYDAPPRFQICNEWDSVTKGEISEDTWIRYQGGIKSDILADVEKGCEVTVLEEMETWSKVKTDGITGYVENKKLTNLHEETPDAVTGKEPEYTNIKKDYRISLAWHQVMTSSANATLGEVTAYAEGLNTISPTWFALSDNEGNFTSIASTDYVAQAHQKGLEVWGLVDNFTNDVDTYSVLSSTPKRWKLVQGLVREAAACGMDGINIDFEQLTVETGEHFVQFIRELSILCRANGIVLSIDNYVPVGNTEFYNRKVQGEVADYVIIMGYDEHWGGSNEAGSVASIDYVEKGIRKTVEDVPAEKVINAVPFYTRVWKTENGQVTSDAVGMNAAEQFLANHNVQASWDETTCQNYASFEEKGILYQVWLEDEQSIEVKLNIMENYGLAGMGAWKLGFERPSVWNKIDVYLHG